jgi:hypothetical protein
MANTSSFHFLLQWSYYGMIVRILPAIKGEGLLVGVVSGLIAASIAILHGNLKNSYFFHKETTRMAT